jgi:galactitol-specific phosphotransferase system IIB component
MPGVKSMIAPNTVIMLESASDSHPSATEVKHQAVIELKVGAVVSDLQKQPGATFDYSIRTPRGLAGARGTTFTVGLNPAGIQTIVVSHGTITLSLADGRTISLTIGQVSVTKIDGTTDHKDKASELSEEDQKFAENWMKTTLETLADAVDNGIDIQPDALENALATAESLGIPVSKELKERVEKLIAKENETKTAETESTQEKTDSADATEIITSGNELKVPANLTPEQLEIFKSLSPEAQEKILALDDPDFTTVVLTPDTDTGLPHSNHDIIRHLTPLIALKKDAAAYALYKELAGADSFTVTTLLRSVDGGSRLPYLDSAPDVAEWSTDAFTRAAAMWNSTASDALTPEQKQQIVAFGLGETVMDRSSSYLSAVFDIFSGLTYAEQSVIQQTGWGKFFGEVANNPTKLSVSSALDTISGYDPALISYLKDFGISPQEFLNAENNYYSVEELLTAINTLSDTDRTTLRQLGGKGNLLNGYINYDGSAGGFVGHLSSAIGFYDSLTTAQKDAVRAIGAGSILFYKSPDDFVANGPGDSTIHVSDRIIELAQYYIDHPSDQQALRDLDLFADVNKGPSTGFFNDSFNIPTFQSIISTYENLPARTRDYLAAEGRNYSFIELYMSSGIVVPGAPTTLVSTESPYRSLANINALLDGLNDDEYAALLDIDAAKAILENNHLSASNAVADDSASLDRFLDFYHHDLGDAQKSTLRELGIVGGDSVAFLGSDPADQTGLSRLLTAYSNLSGSLRASTERLDDNASYSHFGNSSDNKDRSYFFPYGEYQNTLYNISFEAAGDLYVGATKYLVIDNTYDGNVTFVVPSGGDLTLRASNLIDLIGNSGGTTFSAGIRTITMEAATINLTNIKFPSGAGVYMNSKYGGTGNGVDGNGAYPHFGSSAYGRVNFIAGVSYNGNAITDTGTFDSHGGNIHIGSFNAPVVAPPKPVIAP